MRSFACERITPAIGADVVGLDLAAIDEEVVGSLYDALVEHQVLFVRGQPLAVAAQVELALGLGDIAPRHHSYSTHPEHDDVVVLDWQPGVKPDAAEWHSDVTFRPEPAFASVLHAVVVPPIGGDTLWASMYSVHDALDPGLRSDLAQLSAVHDPGAFRTGAYQLGGNQAIGEMLVEAGSAVWPIIATHPVTGRPYLNVSESFTRWIIGLSAPESARLLTMLFDTINRPEHHVRLRWRPGTTAIWDNRGTQHYAVADYAGHRRIMHRVVVQTDRRLSTATSTAVQQI